MSIASVLTEMRSVVPPTLTVAPSAVKPRPAVVKPEPPPNWVNVTVLVFKVETVADEMYHRVPPFDVPPTTKQFAPYSASAARFMSAARVKVTSVPVSAPTVKIPL